MNDDGINPFMGLQDEPAALVMNIPQLDDLDYLVGTTRTERPLSYHLPQDSVPLDLNDFNYIRAQDKVGEEINVLAIGNLFGSNVAEQQAVQPEVMNELERELENFNNPNKLCIEIIDSSKTRNKPYQKEDNILFTKPLNAVTIKVNNAHNGLIVKQSMRYTSRTHRRQPVLVCPEHKDDGQNPDGTFYVSQKIPVIYKPEEGHPTAFITLSQDEDFCFYPIFRCWNFCGKKFGKSQEMMLSVLDMAGNELLHETFDVRVCENVGRDLRQYRKEKGRNGCKRTSTKRSRCRMEEDEDQTSEDVKEGPPPSRPRYFMIKMEDVSLVGTLQSLAKVRGDWIELDPASHPEKYFQ